MVMPIIGMKMIGSVAPALTVGAAGVVMEIVQLASLWSLDLVMLREQWYVMGYGVHNIYIYNPYMLCVKLFWCRFQTMLVRFLCANLCLCVCPVYETIHIFLNFASISGWSLDASLECCRWHLHCCRFLAQRIHPEICLLLLDRGRGWRFLSASSRLSTKIWRLGECYSMLQLHMLHTGIFSLDNCEQAKYNHCFMQNFNVLV